MRYLLSACIIPFVVVGCSFAPTQDEILSANYGSRPTAEQFSSTVEAVVKRRLKDPESAQFQYPYPAIQGWFAQPYGGATHFGYWTCGLVNAKNSFGGYTGFDYFVAVYNDGRVVYSRVASSTEDIDSTRTVCAKSIEALTTQPDGYYIPLG